MKKIILMTLVFALTNNLVAQQGEKCAAVEVYNEAVAKDPSILQKEVELENAISKYIQEKKQSKVKHNATYTIPVVVHVIHNGSAVGTGMNISDNQIIGQIERLNRDFRLQNADSLPQSHPFWNYTADTQIEFCLASKDIYGEATTGIKRYNFSFAGYTRDDINTYIKPVTIWDRNKYLNIWVVDFVAPDESLLGYGTFPITATDSTDGVVIRHQAFGYTGTAGTGNFPTYDLGRTATHEVGHWLNLKHIWGDATCGDDLVADTPTAQASNSGCPSFPHSPNSTCGADADGEMYMNYMDYVNDYCMNMFTFGQKDRMEATLMTARVSLLSSDGCSAVTATTQQKEIKSLQIFPNPTNSIINILSSDSNIQTVELYSVTGQIILTKRGDTENMRLDTHDLPNGNYFLKVQTTNNVFNNKIIILK